VKGSSQSIEECDIWIPHAKVVDKQSSVLKQFLPHKYLIDYGDVYKMKIMAT